MKIMVLTPFGAPDEVKRRGDYVQAIASEGTQIKAFPSGLDLPCPVNGASLAKMTTNMIKHAEEAEEEGFDAILVHGTHDPAIEACRSVTSLPIVGSGEPALYAASMLGDKWGIIMYDVSASALRHIARCGYAQNVASFRANHVGLLEMNKPEAGYERKTIEVAKKQIEEDGAQVIIPFIAGVGASLGVGWSSRMSKVLGVPVIDCVGVGLMMAEMCVRLGMKTSKLAYS